MQQHKEAGPRLGLALLVWGLAVSFYFYETLLTMSPSVMVTELMQAFHANLEQVGYVGAFYGYAYASMQIPAGMLMDRFGPHRLLTVASLLCAVGCFAFVYTHHWILAALSRFIMGLGGGFAVVGCMKVASLWFPPKRFALLAGLMVALGMLGAAAGQKPLALLMNMGFSWQQLLQIGALIGAVFAIAVWFLMHHEPHAEEKPQTTFMQGLKDLFGGLKTVLVSTQTWIASIYAALMFVPTLAFGGMWGVPYWELVLEVETSVAAGHNSMIFIGWAVGGPVFGWLSDHVGRRKPFLLLATSMSTAMMAVILYGHHLSQNVLAAAMFTLGVFSSGFVLAFSIVRESHKPEVTATAIGFVNTLNTLGGALVIPIIGMMMDSKTATLGEMNFQTYKDSLQILIACLIMALFLLPFIRETYCTSVAKHRQ